MEEDHDTSVVDQFLRDQIDTVPHLEALLLLWNSRPRPWSVEEMGHGLFLSREAAKTILDDLTRLGLIQSGAGDNQMYQYQAEPKRDDLIAAVDRTYRRELIRVSRLIHSKPSAAVREFARAFRFKKSE